MSALDAASYGEDGKAQQNRLRQARGQLGNGRIDPGMVHPGGLPASGGRARTVRLTGPAATVAPGK
ncbi:hypothetical protein ACIO3O_41740 [Streptomyces sp. NPDC087440]|uniref:hypothetical protein n=1 Tax=Streptomyces sp. NPDC087440 TaxID=3365790 RepID=UPI0037FAE367